MEVEPGWFRHRYARNSLTSCRYMPSHGAPLREEKDFYRRRLTSSLHTNTGAAGMACPQDRPRGAGPIDTPFAQAARLDWSPLADLTGGADGQGPETRFRYSSLAIGLQLQLMASVLGPCRIHITFHG